MTLAMPTTHILNTNSLFSVSPRGAAPLHRRLLSNGIQCFQRTPVIPYNQVLGAVQSKVYKAVFGGQVLGRYTGWNQTKMNFVNSAAHTLTDFVFQLRLQNRFLQG